MLASEANRNQTTVFDLASASAYFVKAASEAPVAMASIVTPLSGFKARHSVVWRLSSRVSNAGNPTAAGSVPMSWRTSSMSRWWPTFVSTAFSAASVVALPRNMPTAGADFLAARSAQSLADPTALPVLVPVVVPVVVPVFVPVAVPVFVPLLVPVLVPVLVPPSEAEAFGSAGGLHASANAITAMKQRHPNDSRDITPPHPDEPVSMMNYGGG